MPLLINHGVPGAITVTKYLLSILLPFWIHQHATILRKKDYELAKKEIKLEIKGPELTELYDFIIVGGGSSGSVIANRLTAPPNRYSVLLLEAGGDPTFLSYLPGFSMFAQNNPDTDWMYSSSPQVSQCQACKNNQYLLSRGKTLGGCSTANFLIYNRGNPKGFDEWAQLTGDYSWNYANVLNYFKKSENYEGNYPNPAVHGCGGELNIDKNHYHPGLGYFLDALNDHNLTEQDLNANQTNSFMRMDQTSKKGFRWSAYSAFLKPILKRKNFTIHRYSEAIKLVFDPSNATKVIGVEYTRHNFPGPRYAYVRKEVIVTAGSFNSPKLLLLSGIGPKEELENLGIPVRQDLPVGRNLQDHPSTLFPVTFNKKQTSFIYDRDLVFHSIFKVADKSKYGPISGNSMLATGYISSPHNADPTWPDIATFISYLGISFITPKIFGPLFGLNDEELNAYFGPDSGKDGNIVLVTQMRPKSVGYVTLNGTDPRSPPVINTNFFSDPLGEDMKGMVHGMKYMIDFYENSKSYERIGAKLVPAPWPSCANLTFKSDAYYECYIRAVTFTLWHPAGTCKMGRTDDKTAVVDSRLRVIGIQGLRVSDCSIMPVVSNGNTNAVAIMIGEKAADMIIQDAGGTVFQPASTSQCL